MAKATFEVRFNSDKCKGCELCRSFCPKNIIVMSDVVNKQGYRPASITDQDACIGCQSCALVCPDSAIEIYKEEAAH